MSLLNARDFFRFFYSNVNVNMIYWDVTKIEKMSEGPPSEK